MQVTGGKLNNGAENSHLPLRQHERAMLRFRRLYSPRKLASVRSSIANHFNADRTTTPRHHYKDARTAALAEWQALCA